MASNTMSRMLSNCDNYARTLAFMLMLVYVNRAYGMDHCLRNRFINAMDTNYMQFTKEAVSKEYAVLGQFKSLHCCAKGYRSIEWIKDGRAHPWSSDVSSLILYPEAANQTIYTRHMTTADVGNYTCVLRNDTHTMWHYVELKIQEESPEKPLPTFRPHDLSIALGDRARFYCEAFVGTLDLPDAKSHIKWYQMFEDEEQPVEGTQEIVTREDGQIIGSYLEIPSIKSHHYGRYLCRIETGNINNKLEMSAWLLRSEIEQAVDSQFQILAIALAFVTAFLTVFLIYSIKYGKSIWKDLIHFNKNQNRCAAQFNQPNETA